jgi:choline-sulfatase
VPLLFAGPGIRPGQHGAALAETLDIGCTLCDLAGVAPHALDQGRSLAPVLRGERTTHRDTVYSEMGCDRLLRDGRYELMWGEPRFDSRKLGRLHLDKPVSIAPSPAGHYDLAEDPREGRNLAGDPTQRDLLFDLRRR